MTTKLTKSQQQRITRSVKETAKAFRFDSPREAYSMLLATIAAHFMHEIENDPFNTPKLDFADAVALQLKKSKQLGRSAR